MHDVALGRVEWSAVLSVRDLRAEDEDRRERCTGQNENAGRDEGRNHAGRWGIMGKFDGVADKLSGGVQQRLRGRKFSIAEDSRVREALVRMNYVCTRAACVEERA